VEELVVDSAEGTVEVGKAAVEKVEAKAAEAKAVGLGAADSEVGMEGAATTLKRTRWTRPRSRCRMRF
jgi:hypothetical protein